jgi:hypothetical protein
MFLPWESESAAVLPRLWLSNPVVQAAASTMTILALGVITPGVTTACRHNVLLVLRLDARQKWERPNDLTIFRCRLPKQEIRIFFDGCSSMLVGHFGGCLLSEFTQFSPANCAGLARLEKLLGIVLAIARRVLLRNLLSAKDVHAIPMCIGAPKNHEVGHDKPRLEVTGCFVLWDDAMGVTTALHRTNDELTGNMEATG